MMIKRIFAVSIAAILLSVSSLAAACDLSCSFASMKSDCHSQKTESRDSMSGAKIMDGMAMAGMTMPEMAKGESQHAVSALSQANAAHPSIGEMGPCEHQSCGNSYAGSAKTSRSADSHFSSILTTTEALRTNIAPPLIHEARDDVGTNPARDGSLFHLSLRV
jgi:hypothetical protein